MYFTYFVNSTDVEHLEVTKCSDSKKNIILGQGTESEETVENVVYSEMEEKKTNKVDERSDEERKKLYSEMAELYEETIRENGGVGEKEEGKCGTKVVCLTQIILNIDREKEIYKMVEESWFAENPENKQ